MIGFACPQCDTDIAIDSEAGEIGCIACGAVMEWDVEINVDIVEPGLNVILPIPPLFKHVFTIDEILDGHTGRKSPREDVVDETYAMWRHEDPEGYQRDYEAAETSVIVSGGEVTVAIFVEGE